MMHEAALTLFHFILMRTKRCYITEQADTHLVFSKCRRSSTVAMWQYIQQYSNLQIHNDSAFLPVDQQICKAGTMSNKG